MERPGRGGTGGGGGGEGGEWRLSRDCLLTLSSWWHSILFQGGSGDYELSLVSECMID